jgi:hypothetical protein
VEGLVALRKGEVRNPLPHVMPTSSLTRSSLYDSMTSPDPPHPISTFFAHTGRGATGRDGVGRGRYAVSLACDKFEQQTALVHYPFEICSNSVIFVLFSAVLCFSSAASWAVFSGEAWCLMYTCVV